MPGLFSFFSAPVANNKSVSQENYLSPEQISALTKTQQQLLEDWQLCVDGFSISDSLSLRESITSHIRSISTNTTAHSSNAGSTTASDKPSVDDRMFALLRSAYLSSSRPLFVLMLGYLFTRLYESGGDKLEPLPQKSMNSFIKLLCEGLSNKAKMYTVGTAESGSHWKGDAEYEKVKIKSYVEYAKIFSRAAQRCSDENRHSILDLHLFRIHKKQNTRALLSSAELFLEVVNSSDINPDYRLEYLTEVCRLKLAKQPDPKALDFPSQLRNTIIKDFLAQKSCDPEELTSLSGLERTALKKQQTKLLEITPENYLSPSQKEVLTELQLRQLTEWQKAVDGGGIFLSAGEGETQLKDRMFTLICEVYASRSTSPLILMLSYHFLRLRSSQWHDEAVPEEAVNLMTDLVIKCHERTLRAYSNGYAFDTGVPRKVTAYDKSKIQLHVRFAAHLSYLILEAPLQCQYTVGQLFKFYNDASHDYHPYGLLDTPELLFCLIKAKGKYIDEGLIPEYIKAVNNGFCFPVDRQKKSETIGLLKELQSSSEFTELPQPSVSAATHP